MSAEKTAIQLLNDRMDKLEQSLILVHEITKVQQTHILLLQSEINELKNAKQI